MRLNKRIHTSIDMDKETLFSKIIPQLNHPNNISAIENGTDLEKSRKPSLISVTHMQLPIQNNGCASFTDKQLYPNVDDSPCNFHYLHLYINFGFYLLLVPFRPRFQDGHYQLSKNGFHRILCFLSWIIVAFRQSIIIRGSWQTTVSHPTIYYFYLAHAHLHCILTFLLYWILYTKFLSLGIMLEKLSHSCLLIRSANKRNKTWAIIILLHILCSSMGILAPAVGYSVIDSWTWSPSWLFRSYVSRARYAFFMNTNITHINERPEWSEISDLDTILTSAYILMHGLTELHMYLKSLLFGICILTLWTAADSFKQLIQSVERHGMVKSDGKMTQQIVIYLYYEIKEVSTAMNENLGIFCFFYVIDIMPYLATDLDFGLRASDWFDAVKMFRSVLYFAFNMVLSGETYRKAQWFRSWLLNQKNRDLFLSNTQEMELILDELKMEPVGFGANGFYQINYGFAAQVCTTIITFFIITLQYSDMDRKSSTEIR